MRGSRRNKIHPRGNSAIVRSIPAVFPQHSYPHPRETRGFREITAVPIPVHTSSTHPTCVGFARPITGKHVAIHKFGRVVPETRETDSQTDTLIAVLRSATRAE